MKTILYTISICLTTLCLHLVLFYYWNTETIKNYEESRIILEQAYTKQDELTHRDWNQRIGYVNDAVLDSLFADDYYLSVDRGFPN